MANSREEDFDLEVLVVGGTSSGKTNASLAIKQALEKLGAIVELGDEDTTSRALLEREIAVKREEPLLKDKLVIVRQLQRSQ